MSSRTVAGMVLVLILLGLAAAALESVRQKSMKSLAFASSPRSPVSTSSQAASAALAYWEDTGLDAYTDRGDYIGPIYYENSDIYTPVWDYGVDAYTPEGDYLGPADVVSTDTGLHAYTWEGDYLGPVDQYYPDGIYDEVYYYPEEVYYYPDTYVVDYYPDTYVYQEIQPTYSNQPWYISAFPGVGQTISYLLPPIMQPAPPPRPAPPPPAPRPSCTISANSQQLRFGGSTVLSWTSSNATRATLNDYGSVPVSGSQFMRNLTASRTFSLTVSGSGGSSGCYTLVTVALTR